MLKRKIQELIKEYISSSADRILIIDGARQVGKSYIIRHEGRSAYKNYVEVNLLEDAAGERLFANVTGTKDFYTRLSSIAPSLGTKDDTLVFLDEIQAYPNLITMLKFLKDENRFTYIVSGSLLGITLNKTLSKPGGRIHVARMYPLDFEEFLWANGVGADAIEFVKSQIERNISLSDAMHNRFIRLFRLFLIVGGLPDAVNAYVESQNIQLVRAIHEEIFNLYTEDAVQYSSQQALKIRRMYELIPSNMENKKKRLFFNDVEGKKNSRSNDYVEELEYLVSSGVSVEVKAISNPTFPLLASAKKNLIKLYMNDVGLLSYLLFHNNVSAILDDKLSINLGSIYETAVATELQAHKHQCYYYDNKQKGEVDFLVDDYDNLTILPIEVKSGKDYNLHRALTRFLSNQDYGIKRAVVLSNEREVRVEGKITYLPVYSVLSI